jgi:hypothetical protein
VTTETVMVSAMMEVVAAMIVAAVPPAMAAAKVEADAWCNTQVGTVVPIVIVAMPVPTAVVIVCLLDRRRLSDGIQTMPRRRGRVSRHGNDAEHQQSRCRKQRISYAHYVSFREA